MSVTARQPYYHQSLHTILRQNHIDQQNLLNPSQLSDLLVQAPGVSYNGQGGLLQTVNIRGFSRWRVQSLIDGVPVNSERRAGASVAFLPPGFVQQAFVVPGAASTYFGSGAIGGAVDFVLAEPESHSLSFAWGDNQNNKKATYSAAMDNLDWKLSYRTADNGSDGQDRKLLDQFEQSSVFVRQRWDNYPLKQAWMLYSEGNNLGKSSIDYPNNRITLYPTDDHWLGKLTFNLTGMDAGLYWHQSRLHSAIERPAKRINQSRNEALDYGAYLGAKRQLQRWLLNWRLQLDGRSGVSISERELTPQGSLVYANQPLDASQLTGAIVMDVARQYGDTGLALGARLSWQQQQNQQATQNDSNASGFIGLSHLLAESWSISVYLSSAYRTPSLTERFYTGETPRGRVLGDVNLATEQAVNLQAALDYTSKNVSASLAVFRQRIADYIERERLADELLQYRNLDSASIHGLNYQLSWSISEALELAVNGQWLDGQDQDDNALVDISPDNHRLSLSYQGDSVWRSYVSLNYRQNKHDFGGGEQPLSSVVSMAIGGSWQLSPRWLLQAKLNNLTDKLYLTTADDKAPYARGRELQLKLSYQLD